LRESDAFLPPLGQQKSLGACTPDLSPGVRIRPLSPDDLDAVLKTQHACKTVAAWQERDYQTLAGDPRGLILVAETEGRTPPEIVGFSALFRVDAEAELWTLAVAPAHRRRGIGRALLKQASRMLRDAGVLKLFLEVRESNLPALELYRSLGFQQVGRRKDYYLNPRESALIFVRCLHRLQA